MLKAMKLTEEQFKTLSKYERYLQTAVRSNWARYPGITALQEIHSVYIQLTKDQTKLRTTCATCILRLLKDLGAIYFKDKEEKEKEIEMIQSKKVEIAPVEQIEIKKVEVKVRKPRKKKKVDAA